MWVRDQDGGSGVGIKSQGDFEMRNRKRTSGEKGGNSTSAWGVANRG